MKTDVRVGLLMSRVRVEEKWLCAQPKGHYVQGHKNTQLVAGRVDAHFLFSKIVVEQQLVEILVGHVGNAAHHHGQSVHQHPAQPAGFGPEHLHPGGSHSALG